MKIFSILFILLLTACGSESDSAPGQLFDIELSESQKQSFIDAASKTIGRPYKWGGQDLKNGFDCSGLMVWAFNDMGYQWFAYSDGYTKDITAQNFFDFNSIPFTSSDNLAPGDFIFFDANNDNHHEHVSIFLEQNENGFYVLDAYSKAGTVQKRYVVDFWQKNPSFGKPVYWVE